MAVYAYVRTASPSATSAPTQEAIISHWAKAFFLEVVEYFREIGVSGNSETSARPAWKNLMAKLKSGDVIVVTDFARISRDVDVLLIEIRQLKGRGVAVTLAREDE
jgi:DNA invertase Pin-like site-specific DNA recombinase